MDVPAWFVLTRAARALGRDHPLQRVHGEQMRAEFGGRCGQGKTIDADAYLGKVPR